MKKHFDMHGKPLCNTRAKKAVKTFSRKDVTCKRCQQALASAMSKAMFSKK